MGRLTEEAEPSRKAGREAHPQEPKQGKEKDKDSGARPLGRSLIGLVLAPLTDELRTKHDLGKTTKGVIVLEVDPASPAAERNVKVGDVIVEVAQEAVTSIEDVVKGIEKDAHGRPQCRALADRRCQRRLAVCSRAGAVAPHQRPMRSGSG